MPPACKKAVKYWCVGFFMRGKLPVYILMEKVAFLMHMDVDFLSGNVYPCA